MRLKLGKLEPVSLPVQVVYRSWMRRGHAQPYLLVPGADSVSAAISYDSPNCKRLPGTPLDAKILASRIMTLLLVPRANLETQ